jgi:hypothetical protein
MTDLVDTTEMYLRTILDLEEEAIVPLRARISERLGHSGPTGTSSSPSPAAPRPCTSSASTGSRSGCSAT